MSKRAHDETPPQHHFTRLPLLLLPDEIAKQCMSEVARKDLNWLIGLLYVNKDSFESLPRLLPFIVGPSLQIRLDDCGYHNNVYYKTLARYLAPTIEYLGMNNYRGRTLTSAFIAQSFTALKHLVLSETGTLRSPSDLSLMTHLKRLDIAYAKRNDCFNLSTEIHRLSGLTHLDIGGNSAIDDTGLASLTNLVTLDLSCNETIKGTTIRSLTNLETLNIIRYYDIQLPAELTSLVKLRDLSISYTWNENMIIAMLHAMSQLKCLRIRHAPPNLLALLRILFTEIEITEASSSMY